MRLTILPGRRTSRGVLVVLAAGLFLALAALACGSSSIHGYRGLGVDWWRYGDGLGTDYGRLDG